MWGTGTWGVFIWGGGPVYDGEAYHLTDEGDYLLDGEEDLQKDPTIRTRCVVLLKCRRGQWVYNPDVGSRYWTIETLEEGRLHALEYAQEALEPLFQEGLIDTVELLGDVITEDKGGTMYVDLVVTTPEGVAVPLGLIPLGS